MNDFADIKNITFPFYSSAAQAKIVDKAKDPVKYITWSEEWIMRTTALLGRLDTAKLHHVAEDCTSQRRYLDFY